ncbi:MAG: FHA domain-containing protein [Lentisphaeria bacterium]|jgi:pSer/pThr/pTyr-binding forkhead associated (FHA) protein|nr:FHA domain-containing protein [Lentisphaeria bacterium]
MAYLEYEIDGEHKEYTLGTGDVIIGRGAEADLQFNEDPEMSRKHCLIMYRDPEYMLQDKGATNGTFLNDQLVGGSAIPLKDADEIRLGKTFLTFRVRRPGETTLITQKVEKEMRQGHGFGTIMRGIVEDSKTQNKS